MKRGERPSPPWPREKDTAAASEWWPDRAVAERLAGHKRVRTDGDLRTANAKERRQPNPAAPLRIRGAQTTKTRRPRVCPAWLSACAAAASASGFGQRVGLIDRDVEFSALYQIHRLGQGFLHVPAHAGETDAQHRRFQVGDGDHSRRISGQVKQTANDAGAVEVQGRVDLAELADPVDPAVAVGGRDGTQASDVVLVRGARRADHLDSSVARHLQHRGADSARGTAHQQCLSSLDTDETDDAERGFDHRGVPGGLGEGQT